MKIVVRCPNWIGDAVMSIPALRKLREAYPDAVIYLHTRNWAEGVFRDSTFFDRLLLIGENKARLGSIKEQVRELRQQNFDLSVLFTNSFESALIARLANIPDRVGYPTEMRGFLLTKPVDVPSWKKERHESEYYLNLVADLTGYNSSVSNSKIGLEVSQKRRAEARKSLVDLGTTPDQPIITIGAGSTNSLAKRWPAEYFSSLCDLFAEKLSARVVLLGSIDEAPVSSQIASRMTSQPIDLTGKTDLALATAILSESDLFVSNDMGLAHIAAAVGTPTLVIFGPTNERATAPLGENVRAVRELVECAPCMLRDCPIDHRCMTRISPARVFESAAEMLETLGK